MSKLKADRLASFLENDVDIETRTIWLGSVANEHSDEPGVEFQMAERFIKQIKFLESLGSDPITILMNNPGGDVYHGLAIFDSIRYSPCDTTIVVYGHAFSMGSVILQAATRRVMMPNSTMMIHTGTDGLSPDTHAKDFYRVAEEGQRLDQVTSTLLWVKSRLESAELEKLLQFDTFLSPEKALELGFIDEIGS